MKRSLSFFFLCALFMSVAVFGDEAADKRRDVIKYGLEDDVLALLQTLDEEKDLSYTEDLVQLFDKTKSVPIRKGVLSLFSRQKLDRLKEYSLGVLADPYDANKELVRQILSYVCDLSVRDAAPSVRKIIESENSDFRDVAIRALGKIGGAEDAQFLIGYMDSEISGDDKQRLIIRQNVMSALGDMKAVEIRGKLAEIVADKDENAIIRASAATALGKMENPEDVAVLSGLYEETDPILRTASIASLTGMRTPEATACILESFKDSYYKVRLEALNAADKLKLAEAIPYILYRAKTDPVEAVRTKSFEVLALFDDAESRKWLLSVACDEKGPDAQRAKAAEVLFCGQYDFDYAALEKAVIQTLKDDKKIKLRYEFGKVLSKKEDGRTVGLAAAYLTSKDTLTKSIGLDMFAKNRYGTLAETVKAIAADEKLGALQRRAKKIVGDESVAQ